MRIISNLLSVLWFILVMIWIIILLPLSILMIFFFDVMPMLTTGFPSSTIGFIMVLTFAFFLAITGWVPPFRRCYYKLPWLYPYCVILVMDLIILSISEIIINKGFSVISTPRHVITIIIVIIQVAMCRLAMSFYFKKFPLALHKYDISEAN